MAFRGRLDKNEADLTSTTQNLDDAALPCRAAGEGLHAQYPAHSQSLRNLLCALEHYAISCAPSITFDHLRSSRRTTHADSRRVAPSCSTPAARATSVDTRGARAFASEPLPVKKAAPPNGRAASNHVQLRRACSRPRRIDGPSKHEPLCILPEKGDPATAIRPYAPIRSTPNSAFTRSNAAAMALSMS